MRRSEPLQTSASGDVPGVRMHPKTAAQQNVNEGTSVVVRQENEPVALLPVFFDERVPEGTVWILCGFAETSHLSAMHGTVEISVEKIDVRRLHQAALDCH